MSQRAIFGVIQAVNFRQKITRILFTPLKPTKLYFLQNFKKNVPLAINDSNEIRILINQLVCVSDIDIIRVR